MLIWNINDRCSFEQFLSQTDRNKCIKMLSNRIWSWPWCKFELRDFHIFVLILIKTSARYQSNILLIDSKRTHFTVLHITVLQSHAELLKVMRTSIEIWFPWYMYPSLARSSVIDLSLDFINVQETEVTREDITAKCVHDLYESQHWITRSFFNRSTI